MTPHPLGAPQPEADPLGQGCLPNIGPREQARRMRFGLVGLAVSVALAAGMFALGLDRWWRLALFLPWSGAAVGIFQALDKT